MRSLYRLILRLLPDHYDPIDRAEMLDHFDERIHHARRRSGKAGALWAGLSELTDLGGSVFRLRRPTGLADSLRQDLRLGVRTLLREPLISGLAIVSLAVGIGATTAIYSALDVWLVRPLPFEEPDRLVAVAMANRERGRARNPFSIGDFIEWRAATESMGLAAYRQDAANLTLEGRAERIDVVRASANLLDVLGYDTRLGRGFSPRDELVGEPPTVVVSDSFWRTALAGDTAVVGSSLILNGTAHTIVGVLEPGAGFADFRGDVWLPLRYGPDPPRSGHSLSGVGRLVAGASVAAARQELDAVADRVADNDPRRTFPDARVVPLRDEIFGDLYEQGGLVLGAAVLFVLLIACANISNLLFARGVRRTRELAVRGALGAGRGRLLRQLLTENLVLALLGGVLGVGLARLGVEALVAFVLPPDVPGWGRIALDGRVLGAAAAVTLLSSLIFGLAPALRGSRVDLRERLGDGGTAGPSRSRRRLSNALVVAEIAVALTLVASTGLLIGSLARLYGTEIDFRTEDAVSFRLYATPASAPDAEAVRSFHSRITERIMAVPGVTGVAQASGPPIGRWSTLLYTEGAREPTADQPRRSAENRVVSTSYLEVMRLPLLAGRWFSDETDVAGAPPVAVVSRVLAEASWESVGSAVGQRLQLGNRDLTVVGVVETGRMRGPQRPAPPVVFRSLQQFPVRSAFYVVETDLDLASALVAVRSAIGSVDPTVALARAGTLEDAVGEALATEHVTLRIFGTLAALALVLTLVGVYGVMAHSVAQRDSEMGLRLALGATNGRLIRLVLGQSARTALVGLAVGTGISLLLGQALAGVLQGVESNDPGVLLLCSALMLLAVLSAAFVPARRATRADPAESLQGE